jgi:iron(III)-salmochelin esterase
MSSVCQRLWPLWFALACNPTARESPGPSPVSASAAEPPRTVAPNAASAEASAAPAAAPNEGPWPAAELTWRFPHAELGEMVVVVHVPATAQRLPVLVTMHGLGESEKGPERGARGWTDDYALPRALRRLGQPPLADADLEKLSSASRLATLNASLAAHPYGGLVVVTPYTPNILAGDRSLDAAEPLGRFLVDDLLPRVRRETPALSDPAATGIDGVSLGGRAALLVGLSQPQAFGAVASLQAAIYAHELDEITRRAATALAQNPNLRLRLLTSTGDFYRASIERLATQWKGRGLEHRLDVVDGPHSYAFNRGPGVYEMLLFHDRALRGQPYL